MAKFKKGQRVRNIQPDSKNTLRHRFKFGDTGTVDEEHDIPYVIWDNGKRSQQAERYLELISESPDLQEDVPQPGTIEYWRWTLASQAMQALIIALEIGNLSYNNGRESLCKNAVIHADTLIAELRKKQNN